jgi:two-component system response regulator NreC
MIDIILADDHSLVRYGIKLLLEADPQISVIRQAKSGLEVLDELKAGNHASMVLTDMDMPGMGGMELLKIIKTDYPQTQVVFLTMMESDTMISEAFGYGADGYLLKTIDAEEMVYAINHIYKGGKYISAALSHTFFMKSLQIINAPLVEENSDIILSSREIEVLTLISDGYTNMEISEKLYLSKRTIEGHRQSMIDKTKTRNTASLVKYAVTHGLIS